MDTLFYVGLSLIIGYVIGYVHATQRHITIIKNAIKKFY